jgi:TRAP-type transport system periplasmic protein
MKRHRLIPVLAAALILAACSSSDDDGDGVAGEPVTLLMASPYDDPGWNYTPAVGHFVDQVEQLSGGNVSIEMNWGYGDLEPDAEQQIVSAVANGEVDLAWVGTRVFDTLGVTSFQALHAPLLVDSYELQEAILASDIPTQMLAGLDELDVTGLAVLAGGLRKPIAVDGPLLGPDHYAGATIQAFRSDAQTNTVIALGATPTDVVAGERDAGLVGGEIQGMEHTLRSYLARGMWSYVPYVTANVNLWPETTVLLVNPDTLAELSDVQAGWLYEAAADAAARSAELHNHDGPLVVEACEQGGRFAEASEADLAALLAAVEPVYAELEASLQTAEMMSQVTELKASVAAEPLIIPDDCTGEAPVIAAAGVDSDALPPGWYTTGEVTVEQVVAALIATGIDGQTADEFILEEPYREYVIWELQFTADGRWQLLCTFDGRPDRCESGTYEVVDDSTVVLTEDPPHECWDYTLEFSLTGDQLEFEMLDVDCPGEDPDEIEHQRLVMLVVFEPAPFTRVD